MKHAEKVYCQDPDDELKFSGGGVISYKMGYHFQSSPMLFTKEGHSLWHGDMYKGCSAYLCLGGPSFKNIDKRKLLTPGFITMGVNNVASDFIPDLWVAGDPPDRFLESIWMNPRICKFVPFHFSDKEIQHEGKVTTGDCPNVCYFRRSNIFLHEQFLTEGTFGWKSSNGKKSTLLIALKLLFYLGVRNVYLLGCDFHMDIDNPYSFESKVDENYVNKNNELYKVLIRDLEKLNPHFIKHNFNVYNCNKDSNLKVFDFIDFEESLKITTSKIPISESTEYMYIKPK